MSFLPPNQTSVVRAAQQKRKGGSPEDARQEVKSMQAVAEVTSDGKKPRILISTDSPDKKASDWLNLKVKQAGSGVTSEVVSLTPALARVLLNRNAGNRKINEVAASSYARDMKNSAWVFNGEPIIISKDGMLNDGQHRCEAVVRADVEISVIMVFGVERDTRTTLDQGRIRTVGDYLSMDGYANTAQLGSAASMVWQFIKRSRFATGSADRPTKGEIISFISENDNLVDSLNFCSRKGVASVGGISLVAATHWIIAQKAGRKPADDFIIALVDGAALVLGNPVLYARNRLINERGRLRANDKAELIFRAWNAHRRGVQVKVIQIGGGKLPEVEA